MSETPGGVQDVISGPLPTLQSETWLVHANVREPHLNPLVRMNFPGFSLVLKGKARKVHTNQGVQMWFANFRVNQPCFRLECRERSRLLPPPKKRSSCSSCGP